MAAYAALNSVIYILHQIQHHPRPPITIEKLHMDSLCEIISVLQDFLENYSHRDIGDDGKEALESRIADAAYAAEDIIESHIVDQILTEDGEKNTNNLFYQDLQKLIEDMNLIRKEVIKIQEKIRGINNDNLPRNIIGSSTGPPPKRKNTNTMVGFDDVLIQIMDRLTGHPPNRQVLPIVGMGGIGKTTLARHAYDNLLIVKHFDIRIWITISQEYRLLDILIEALSCLSKTYRNDENKCEDELGHELYKSLWGRRYLIILDDVWSIEAWEVLMLFLPDNYNGSRIMITTRLSNVSNHFRSCGFTMNFLDEDKCWELFCKVVFPEDQCCPVEFEKIGKKIARNCKGLPLLIVVIGGILANSGKTRQHWEYVAENLISVVNLDGNEHCCLTILALSYNHLPVHLKPCFLYMGVYPEDGEIRVSELINLWVSEGFLKPIKDKSLEVVAEDYLNELIDRNLVLIHKLGSGGNAKFCKMHDLVRDLCIREGEKNKFAWVRTVHDLENLQGIQFQRRISIHNSASSRKGYLIDQVLKKIPSSALARSLTCDFEGIEPFLNFRLVRVFKMAGRHENVHLWGKYTYPLEDIFKLVNSRYLDFSVGCWDWDLIDNSVLFPSSIQLLWNLQTLIIDGPIRNIHDVTPQLWKMTQLRHVDFHCDGPEEVENPLDVRIHEGDDEFVLKNLHTLKGMKNLSLSDDVIKRNPQHQEIRSHLR